MNPKDLTRPHVFVPGTGRTLLLLHGTGADEHDLMRLGSALDQDSAKLSPRGMVSENGMNRFFERRPDGSFVQESVIGAVSDLKEFLVAAQSEYEFPKELIAAGFSNGANTAIALMVLHPEVIDGAILFGSTRPLEVVPNADLRGKRIWIANGVDDPYAPEAVTAEWVDQLRAMGAEVKWLSHPGGHQISPAHLQEISRDLT